MNKIAILIFIIVLSLLAINVSATPIISLVSPTNTTYNTTRIQLNVTNQTEVDSWWYNLNSGSNTTFTPNITITAKYGSNFLIVYANDTSNNENSTNVTFSTSNYLNACSVLNQTNMTYYITENIINSSISCMYISARNVTLDCQGHTIDGIYDKGAWGIKVINTNNTIRNCILTDWWFGVDSNSTNNILDNINVSSSYHGIYIILSGYNEIYNSILSGNTRGIVLYSSHNKIKNCTIKNSIVVNIDTSDADYNEIYNSSFIGKGIRFYGSDYNTIHFNKFDGGICIEFENSRYNKIYNNLFNYSGYYAWYYEDVYLNYWNIDKQAGNRIYSPGIEIGGNYWTNSAGNGYSDTCTDADEDGFCDSYYELHATGPNRDYLPLSDEYAKHWIPPFPPPPPPIPPTPNVPAKVSTDYVKLKVSYRKITRTVFGTKVLTAIGTITGIIGRTFSGLRAIVATPQITDILSSIGSFLRTSIETVYITEAFFKLINIFRTLIETVVSTIIVTVIRFLYIIPQIITIVNIASRQVLVIRGIVQSITIIVTVLKNVFVQRLLEVLPTIVNIASRQIWAIRGIVQDITITDILIRTIIFVTREIVQLFKIIIDFITIGPIRVYYILHSPPYGLFEWATRFENLILIFIVIGGISGISLYWLWIRRRLIETPIERYFGRSFREFLTGKKKKRT